MSKEITVLCVVRHGHGTTPVCLEALYANTQRPINVICVDVAGPPSVAGYLANLESSRSDFMHLRLEKPVSRQTARLIALPLINSELVVLLDNNMLCGPGCIDTLADVQGETAANLVSPIIVTQGGRVHFSGGTVVRRRDRLFARRQVHRPHTQPSVPLRSLLKETQPKRVEIDFAESHCCLVRTEDLRLPGVIEERMHNSHTACYASYLMKRNYGKTLVLDPAAIVSILPIAFGYDIPWLFQSYMRRDWLDESYQLLEHLIGSGPGTAASSNLPWHLKHLKYLLLTLLDNDRFFRDDYLGSDEIPDYIPGYDFDLPVDADERVNDEVMPVVRLRYPAFADTLEKWLMFGRQ